MATVEEIAKGISQVMADSYDGALDEEGKHLDTGLKRGGFDVKLTDRRVNDGFSLSLSGNILLLNYQSEISVKELHSKDFESDVEDTLAQVLKFVKKHYKKVTGNTLKCKPVGDPDIDVQSTSRVHTWVNAQARYEIQGMDKESSDIPDGDERLDKSIRDWLELGKKSKKPENVTAAGLDLGRPKNSTPKGE
tara:strand:+ start:5906 stop:6481 length:576 start_codon:yes stop_codon:yes gene_type:complete